MKTSICCVFSIVLVILLPSNATAAAVYHLTDIGDLPGGRDGSTNATICGKLGDEEFAVGKTLWRFHNAMTEVWKGRNLAALPRRSQALHGLLDSVCALAV
jgi:hypothetical protein